MKPTMIKHEQQFQVDAFKGQSLIASDNSSIYYFDAHNEQLVCTNPDFTSITFTHPIKNVKLVKFQNGILVVATSSDLLIFKQNQLQKQLQIGEEPLDLSYFNEKLFLLSKFSQKVQIFDSNFQQIEELKCKDATQLVNNLLVCKHCLWDLEKKKETQMRIPGFATAAAALGSDVLIASTERQLLVVNREGKVVKTLQHVAKSQVLFIELFLQGGEEKSKEEKILLASEANEIIYANFGEAKKKQAQTITQVKQDYYGSEFKGDGMWLGVAKCGETWVGLTDSYFYVWK